MLDEDGAAGLRRSMEPSAVVVDQPSDKTADLILNRRQVPEVSLAKSDQGLLAQLTSNPFFTAVCWSYLT